MGVTVFQGIAPVCVTHHPGQSVTYHSGSYPTPGRRKYLQYLAWLQEDDLAQRHLQFERLSKGWVIGTRDFKRDLINEHRHLAAALERGEAEAGASPVESWEERIRVYLKALAALTTECKSAGWKVAVAAAMKSHTTASNPWLAARLHMGSPFRLSRLVSACRTDPGPYAAELRRIAKCKV